LIDVLSTRRRIISERLASIMAGGSPTIAFQAAMNSGGDM